MYLGSSSSDAPECVLHSRRRFAISTSSLSKNAPVFTPSVTTVGLEPVTDNASDKSLRKDAPIFSPSLGSLSHSLLSKDAPAFQPATAATSMAHDVLELNIGAYDELSDSSDDM